MPIKTTNTETIKLKAEVTELNEKVTHMYKRLGGLRYHVIQESANGNDLSPVDFVRLVDNIIDDA
jgi:hypothetical protein